MAKKESICQERCWLGYSASFLDNLLKICRSTLKKICRKIEMQVCKLLCGMKHSQLASDELYQQVIGVKIKKVISKRQAFLKSLTDLLLLRHFHICEGLQMHFLSKVNKRSLVNCITVIGVWFARLRHRRDKPVD